MEIGTLDELCKTESNCHGQSNPGCNPSALSTAIALKKHHDQRVKHDVKAKYQKWHEEKIGDAGYDGSWLDAYLT